jgi:hypothetical protein
LLASLIRYWKSFAVRGPPAALALAMYTIIMLFVSFVDSTNGSLLRYDGAALTADLIVPEGFCVSLTLWCCSDAGSR